MSSQSLARRALARTAWPAPPQSMRIGWSSWLALVALAPFVVPLLWLLSSALKPVAEFYASPPTLLPSQPTLDNLLQSSALVQTPRLVMNSLFVAGLSSVLAVVSSAVVGFAFAALPARGSGVLFAILIGTILIPPAALLVPQFILFSRLGWVGSYLPLIVPHLFGSAFYIFLFRQWFKNLPAHLFESAELDGANPLQIFVHIALPLSRPALAVVAIFAFVGAWNDFMGPLVYLRSPESFTLSLGMATLEGVYVRHEHLLVATALIALVPPMALFAVAHRWLAGGLARAGWHV